jgi:hypothetical protein
MSRGRIRRLAAIAGTTLAMSMYGLAVAPSALAVPTCTFSGGTIAVTATGAETIDVRISDAANNPILVNGSATCGTGAPLLTTTTAINISGDSTGVQTVNLWLSDTAGDLADWGAINWTINLGSDTTPAPGDGLLVYNADGSDTSAIDLVAGANGIDLNNDDDLDVTVAGIDAYQFESDSEGDDVISGAGSDATGAAFPQAIQGLDGPGIGGGYGIYGGDGDDVLTGGAAGDEISGEGDYDTLAGGLGDDVLDGEAADYSGSATAVTVNLTAGTSVGEGIDTLMGTDDAYGSDLNDTISGHAGGNWIWGGPGDDVLDGEDGFDYVSYYGSNGVEVDLNAGTATGDHGTDTLSDFEGAEGGRGADKLKGLPEDYDELYGLGGNDKLNGRGCDGCGDWLDGGNGTDQASYGFADGVAVELADGDCDVDNGEADYGWGTDDLLYIENARLSSGDDSFVGSQFQNKVWPNGGQNTLVGDCGTTNSGGDTLDYSKGYGNKGVTVNMAGGATAGDSATGFEAATGSNGDDFFTGNELSNTIDGGKGADVVRGGSGDDDVEGGKGQDSIRGGSGDDTINGGKGRDEGFGGSGDDWGKSLEVTDSIELGPSA